jgi:hypothetical protein
MRTLSIFGELLPVLGTIGLLGLWLYQQTGIEQRANELRNVVSARSVYQTYQSNNALFNAVNEAVGKKEAASHRLRTFQLYNYELGLHAIEGVLPETEKADIPAAPYAYDSSQDIENKMTETQKRLEILQVKLDKREEELRAEADAARRRYMLWYIALSLISVFGAICKVIEKASAKPS